MARSLERRVVEIEMPDGTVVRRLVKVMAPDRRRPNHVNRVHTGRVRGPRCGRCGQTPRCSCGGCATDRALERVS